MINTGRYEIVFAPIRSGSVEAFKPFVEAEPAILDQEFGHGETCFMEALRHTPERAIPFINFLLEQGADPNGCEEDVAPLKFAVLTSSPDVVEIFERHGATADNLKYLPWAVSSGNFPMVRYESGWSL